MINLHDSAAVQQIAQQDLIKNRVDTSEGPLILAGGHQFHTFWVRDFCFSVPGLLLLHEIDLVRRQLEVCLKFQAPDGMIARGFDVINPKTRVLGECLGLSMRRLFPYAGRELKPEYLGEHGTAAADSNLLLLQAVLDWTEATGDFYFFDRHGPALRRCFDFVLRFRKGELLVQPSFSDWQDSARRSGKTSYLNVLFLKVLRGLQQKKIPWAQEIDFSLEAFWREFYDAKAGLLRSQSGKDQYSLETQLWCIESDLLAPYVSRAELWQRLTVSPLWGSVPGRPVWPAYAARDISWTTKCVGLKNYHDGFLWSWLMAESLRMSFLMKDEKQVRTIFAALQTAINKSGTVHEIYAENHGPRPVRKILYSSESPFTWGAAKIIEALSGTGRI